MFTYDHFRYFNTKYGKNRSLNLQSDLSIYELNLVLELLKFKVALPKTQNTPTQMIIK